MNQKVDVGETVKKINQGRLTIGILCAVAGMILLTILLKNDGEFLFNIRELSHVLAISAIIFSVFMTFIGVALCLLAYVQSTDSMYLEKGYCSIMDQRIPCGGGCNKCVVAKQYLEIHNGPEEKD